MSESWYVSFASNRAGLSSSRRCFIRYLAATSAVGIFSSNTHAASPESLARQLTDANWPAAAAKNVAEIHSPIQQQIELADPALAESRFEKLKQLAKYPAATRLLVSHPQLAGFLIHSSDPMQVAETLANYANHTVAINSLMMHAAEAQVIGIFRNHQKSLLRLPRDGEPFDSVPVELYLNTSSDDRDYKRFVDDLLIWTQGDSARRRAIVGSLTRCSDRVRYLFRSQPEDALRASIAWMEFCDVHPDHGEWMCGMYFELDTLLHFFMRPSGREMAENAGVAAIELFETEKLSAELTRVLPRVVLLSDKTMLASITSLKDHFGLVSLLSRKTLSASSLKAALLSAEGNTDQLAKWTKLTDNAIARDVGTADIGVWEHVPFVEVAVKIVDGRELTAIDGVLVAVDTASLVFPFAKGGSVGLRSAGSIVKSDVLEVATKAYGKSLGTKAAKMSAKQLQKQLPDVFEAAAKKAMRQRLRQGGLDITGLTRLAYQQVGKRSKTFKRFTSLDSKVFMRSDRVVVIYPHRTMVGQVLREVIEGAMASMAVENSGDSIVEGKDKVESYTQKLGAIWVACNEPGGIGEILSLGGSQ
jgi:hypothetical protein